MSTKVELQHLRKLYVEHSFTFVAALNKCLHVPADAAICLHVNLNAGDTARYSTNEDLMADIITPGYRAALESERGLYLSAQPASFLIKSLKCVRRDQHSSGVTEVPGDRIHIYVDGSLPPIVRGLRTLLTIHPSGQLSSLIVPLPDNRHGSYGCHTGLDEWRTALGAFPLLEQPRRWLSSARLSCDCDVDSTKPAGGRPVEPLKSGDSHSLSLLHLHWQPTVRREDMVVRMVYPFDYFAHRRDW